jgi:hypothetical protein
VEGICDKKKSDLRLPKEGTKREVFQFSWAAFYRKRALHAKPFEEKMRD